MNANVVERVAERMEELEAKLALCEGVLRDVKQLARAGLVDEAAQQATRESLAATLNSISTRIAAAQQALRVTEDAEHKRGHEKDDAALLAWAASVGLDNLEPASRLKALAARRRLNAKTLDGGGTGDSAVSTLHAGAGSRSLAERRPSSPSTDPIES